MPKNVLILITDQQRRDSLGCYGNPGAQTPCLDRFAQSAVQFERAYVANPICMPNRHSLFSGRYPHNHGVYTNGLLLPDTGCNLPHYLSENGWQTANIGKIHFTPHGRDHTAERKPLSPRAPGRTAARIITSMGRTGALTIWSLRWDTAGKRAITGSGSCKNGGSDAMYEGKANPEIRCAFPCICRNVCILPPCWGTYRKLAQREAGSGQAVFLVASFPDPHHPFDPPEETAARFPWRVCPLRSAGPEDLETPACPLPQAFPRRGAPHWCNAETYHAGRSGRSAV